MHVTEEIAIILVSFLTLCTLFQARHHPVDEDINLIIIFNLLLGESNQRP
jgi:hypothetical protein